MKKLITLFSLVLLLLSCNNEDKELTTNPLVSTWKVVQKRERNIDGTTWSPWVSVEEIGFFTLTSDNKANITTRNYSYNGTYTYDSVDNAINANFPDASNPDKYYKITYFTTNLMVLESYYFDSGYQYKYVKIN